MFWSVDGKNTGEMVLFLRWTGKKPGKNIHRQRVSAELPGLGVIPYRGAEQFPGIRLALFRGVEATPPGFVLRRRHALAFRRVLASLQRHHDRKQGKTGGSR